MNRDENLKKSTSTITILAIVHGLYFFIGGIWPIVNMESFVAVTGPKVDYWLVRTVGLLTFFIGAGLLTAGAKKHVSFPLIVIAMGSALSFALIDIIYVWQGVLLSVYLLDALAECILLICWIVFTYKSGQYELFYERQG